MAESRVRIFTDGRVQGSAPVSASDFVTKEYADRLVTGSVTSASYDSNNKRIELFNSAGTAVASVDATAFTKDGMVSTVAINTGSAQMVITFNTDAGKEDITLNLVDIFNPANYYTKADIDATTGSWSSASAWITENSESLLNGGVWVQGTGSGSAVLSGSEGTATGQYTVVQGYRTTGSSDYSHVEGYYSVVSGSYGHAEGAYSIASGVSAHAEGSKSLASGETAHAEGFMTTASGFSSHAEGYWSMASGDYAHAEGFASTASGYAAHAEGYRSTASGEDSHVEGYYSEASGPDSHAEGYYTVATNQAEHAQGKYNATASSQIFSVGVGESNSGRKNAFSILTGSSLQSASTFVYGVGSYDGTNPQPGVNDLATTIKNVGLPAVTNSDNGKILMVVSGSWDLVIPLAVYNGSAAPSETLGNNGDIYLQTT